MNPAVPPDTNALLQELVGMVRGLTEELRALRRELLPCLEKGSDSPAQEPKRLLSKAAAAKRLGISPDRTLPKVIALGLLQPVMVGARAKIPLAQLERLEREGFNPDAPLPMKRRPPRVLPNENPGAAIRALKF